MLKAAIVFSAAGITGCGGSAHMAPPVVVSVSLSDTTIEVQQGTMVHVPVMIVAPTETATFGISGLPAGVVQSYKESESNPSGLLTLTANASAQTGTFMPTITVGSSGQTASLVFKLVVAAPAKTSGSTEDFPNSAR
jgi:hypothetical protein